MNLDQWLPPMAGQPGGKAGASHAVPLIAIPACIQCHRPAGQRFGGRHLLDRQHPRAAIRCREATVCKGCPAPRSEEHTSELQSLMRNSYAVFCLTQKSNTRDTNSLHISKTNTQTNTINRNLINA